MNWRILAALCTVALLAWVQSSRAGDWVRGGDDGSQTRWGLRGGLQFAIAPAVRGPRGLIRVMSPTLADGKYELVNFIAVEPIVGGVRNFSELEPSQLDGKQGKRFWVDDAERAGTIRKIEGDVEVLSVIVHVERFVNGADVKLQIEQRSDRPDEIALKTRPAQGSAAMEYCILTATMGNKARARLLWLNDGAVSSLKLYGDYTGPDFAATKTYPRSKLTVTRGGDVLVAITTNEEKPADVRPFPGSNLWYWGGATVTQYWMKRAGAWRDDLHAAVNARYIYWGSNAPVPGGIAFENFEMREKFEPGQEFIFGITRKTPAELGIGGGLPSTVPSK